MLPLRDVGRVHGLPVPRVSRGIGLLRVPRGDGRDDLRDRRGLSGAVSSTGGGVEVEVGVEVGSGVGVGVGVGVEVGVGVGFEVVVD
jgi:hypothetical protein